MPVVPTICLPHLDVDAEASSRLEDVLPEGALPEESLLERVLLRRVLHRVLLTRWRGPRAGRRSPPRLWNPSAVVAALASA
jgi:hypothetical protein